MQSFYFEGANGRQYHYAHAARRECPYDQSSTRGHDPELRAEFLERGTRLAELGIDVARVFRAAHSGSLTGECRTRRGYCGSCGARLTMIGYAVWIAIPIDEVAPESLDDDGRRNVLIHRRIGATHWTLKETLRHFGLRREAADWASEEAAFDQSLEAERAAL